MSSGAIFIVVYVFLGADKPSKQMCIAEGELKYITAANASEDCGQKRNERKVRSFYVNSSKPLKSVFQGVYIQERERGKEGTEEMLNR